MPTTSDWLLIILLPGLFFALAIGLLVVLRKAFREPEGPAEVPGAVSTPAQPPSQTRLLWIGIGLGLLAATVALGALFLVVWNAGRR